MLQSMHTLADKQPEERYKELSADTQKFYEDSGADTRLEPADSRHRQDVGRCEVWVISDLESHHALEDAGWFVQFCLPEKDYNEAWQRTTMPSW